MRGAKAWCTHALYGKAIKDYIIIVGFIERKIDTNPLMRLSPRRESPGTGMGRYLKSARQGITKVGSMPV